MKELDASFRWHDIHSDKYIITSGVRPMFGVIQRLFRRKTVGYVSPIDKFQAEWDATHPNTASQLAEIKKYQRVYALRDKPSKQEEK